MEQSSPGGAVPPRPREHGVAHGIAPRARCCAAAALSDLPRASGAAWWSLCRVLVETLIHRAALLCASRYSVRLRSRSWHFIDGGDRRAAVLQQARSAVRFDDMARKLIHALKYGDRTDLAPAAGRWMASSGRDLLSEADALVPVPLHWRRVWARRFNQSAALAHSIARASGVAVAADLLKRVKATPQQVGLSRTERGGERARRVSRSARCQGPRRGPAIGACRRRDHVGRDGRGLRAHTAARGRCQRRRPHLGAGCERGAATHINRRRDAPGLGERCRR